MAEPSCCRRLARPVYSQEGQKLFLWRLRTRAHLWPRMAYEPMHLETEGFASAVARYSAIPSKS